MSEAPERIWVKPEFKKEFMGCDNELWSDASTKSVFDGQVEYVRADLFEELEVKLAKAITFTILALRYAKKKGDGDLAELARTTLAERTGGKDVEQ